ncbi:HNH endonuclease [Candidatus Saccharibacteria bacterium]|nr:HNH endonuclease [Candidatus Saccharibacteria bacterium]
MVKTQKSKRRTPTHQTRRALAATLTVAALVGIAVANPSSYNIKLQPLDDTPKAEEAHSSSAETSHLEPLGESASAPTALAVLAELPVKGRASKTGYARTEFYNSWPTIDGCSLRQRIIRREVGETAVVSSADNCTVVSGEYTEPYTGSHLIFYQKSDFTSSVQIDHIVALSDAWQKGAQKLTKDERYALATDPLNLLAVDAKTNVAKSDGDAATWLPPNKTFRCAYVARQVSVKYKYHLWVTQAEKTAIETVLSTCPSEPAVGVSL